MVTDQEPKGGEQLSKKREVTVKLKPKS